MIFIAKSSGQVAQFIDSCIADAVGALGDTFMTNHEYEVSLSFHQTLTLN